MQPSPAQNLYAPSNMGVNSVNIRTNSQAINNLHHLPPTNPAANSRLLPNTIYSSIVPSVHMQYSFPSHQPQYQQYQCNQHYYSHNCYFQIPQRNTSVGVGVGNTMSMQPGSLAGPSPVNQTQISLGVPSVTSAILKGNTSPDQSIGINPLAGLMQTSQPTVKKKRAYVLDIIDPKTNRNILEDFYFEKCSNSQVTLQETNANGNSILPTTDVQLSSISTTDNKNYGVNLNCNNVHTCVSELQTVNQTPVVSAIADVPSVEIHPAQMQKSKTKKFQICTKESHITENTSNLDDTPEIEYTADSNISNGGNVIEKAEINISYNYSTNHVPQIMISKRDNDQNESIITPTIIAETNCNINAAHSIGNKSLDEPILTTYTNINDNNVSCNQQQNGKDNLINTVNNSIINKDSTDDDAYVNNNENPITSDITNICGTINECLNQEQLLVEDSVVEKVEIQHLSNDKNFIDCNKTHSINNDCNEIDINKKENKTENDILNINRNGNKFEDKNEFKCENLNHQKNICDSKIFYKNGIESQITKKVVGTKSMNNEKIKKLSFVNTTNQIIGHSMSFDNIKTVISYDKGQWSPFNPKGEKKYKKEQLMLLRDVKASRLQPEVKNRSILPNYNLMPSFALSTANKKFQSMVRPIGNSRSGDMSFSNHYTKQSSTLNGGDVNNTHHNRDSAKPIIHVNLSLDQDVKLSETDNAWRPRMLLKPINIEDPEMKKNKENEDLVRRVRGILNKLTPERFDTLLQEILNLKIDTTKKMDAVIAMVYEKAIDEPNFSASYARLCYHLVFQKRDPENENHTESQPSKQQKHFRKFLDKMQKEFLQNVINVESKDAKLKPIKVKIKECTDSNKKAELEELLQDEERKIRRRSGGTVRFLGELFKISILTNRITYSCIESLVKKHDNEDMLECLCKLLSTVGEALEKSLILKSDTPRYSLDSVIQSMKAIADKTENSKISSRVRFMLKDVIELRENNWRTTRNEVPKTMEQIEKDAKNELLSAQSHNYSGSLSGNISGSNREDRSDRYSGEVKTSYAGSHSQRNDGNNLKRNQHIGGSNSGGSSNDGSWQTQSKGGRGVRVDPNKLEHMRNLDTCNRQMGGASVFQWAKASTSSNSSNLFAPLLTLESNSSSGGEYERSRDQNGKLSRNSSSQSSQDNFVPRNMHSSRNDNTEFVKEPASHSKYSQVSKQTIASPSSSIKMKISNLNAANEVRLKSEKCNEHQKYHLSEQKDQNSNNTTINPYESNILILQEPLLSKLKSKVHTMIENVANSISMDDTIQDITSISEVSLPDFLYYILYKYLHLQYVTSICRRHLSKCIAHLIEKEFLSVEQFKLVYRYFMECVTDLILDVPELFQYIIEFVGPLIVKGFISVHDLWNKDLLKQTVEKKNNNGTKFLGSFLQYFTHNVGPKFTRKMWKTSKMQWLDYMNENEIIEFIETHKFEYIENENISPSIKWKGTKEEIQSINDHIDQLLREKSDPDVIIDFISGNIVNEDKTFVRSLTTTLSKFAIKYSNNCKLDSERFQKFCIPILLYYINSNEELEFECLYALQLLVYNLEHPPGLLSDLFIELKTAYVISKETFIKWRDSKDQTEGKGVAVKAVNPFFNDVLNGETSDDN